MRRPIARDINQRKRVSGSQIANWVNIVNPLDYKPSLWLDASDITTITESSGAVSQWNDKSGNEFHVSQSTSGAQPTTGTRMINGLNVLDFDASGTPDRLLRTTDSQLVDSVTGVFTVFAVFNSDTVAATTAGIISQDNGTGTRMPQMIRRATTSIQTVRIAGGVFVDAPGINISANTTYLSAVQHRSTNIEVWLNGSSDGATNVTGSNGTVASRIGVGVNTSLSGTPAEFFDGMIAEIIVIPRNLSNLQLNQLGTYLVRKWACTWTWA